MHSWDQKFNISLKTSNIIQKFLGIFLQVRNEVVKKEPTLSYYSKIWMFSEILDHNSIHHSNTTTFTKKARLHTALEELFDTLNNLLNNSF